MTVDQKGRLWVCQAQSKGLLCLGKNGRVEVYQDQGDGWPDNPEAILFNPQDEQLYVGGTRAEKPLFRFDEAQGRFIQVEGQLEVDKEQDLRVIDLKHSEDHGLVLGASLGLFCYTDEGYSAVSPEKTNGISVSALSIGADNEIWFATANGLNRLEDSVLLTYTTMHGLPSKAINWRSIRADSSGGIWVGTPNGLAISVQPMPDNTTGQPLLLQVESSKGVVYEKASNRFEADIDDYLSVRYLSVGYPSTLTEYRIHFFFFDYATS